MLFTTETDKVQTKTEKRDRTDRQSYDTILEEVQNYTTKLSNSECMIDGVDIRRTQTHNLFNALPYTG